MSEPHWPHWAIITGPRMHDISIEPVENSCRTYGCCGGTECGLTTAEAQAQVVNHFQRWADYWRELTPQAFLEAQGYHDVGTAEETPPADPA
jgi:hypothetical protein